ncbi:unnamed protein product [Rotaria sp. Silwood2]|nr:unnamed protein product [Rotaria sp. Silwood2]CAF4583500.1 unnamed protein product [Rotaria sp. Silwood2]
MGQHLSSINYQLLHLTESDRSIPSPAAILSNIGQEDVSIFLSSEISSNKTNDENRMARSWIKQIQNYLYLLTYIPDFGIINTTFDNIFISIITDYRQIIQEINNNLQNQEQLKTSFAIKQKDHNNNRQQSSITSKLSSLFKSAERHISPRTPHISESKKDSSSSHDRITERQLERVLHNFLFSTTSLKDVLYVLKQLLFDTTNVYAIQNILAQLNDRFTAIRSEWEKEQINNNNNELNQTTG